MQSGAESVLSLIKKASYLADKGQVTFGCNLKHFPKARSWKWARLWAYQRECWGREKIGRAVTAGIVLHGDPAVLSWYAGANCSSAGLSFQHRTAWWGFIWQMNQLEGAYMRRRSIVWSFKRLTTSVTCSLKSNSPALTLIMFPGQFLRKWRFI